MDERVVLVDPDDRPLGSAPKLEAHRSGVLHRAFSVFLFDDEGRLLLQQRAHTKYHGGGLWANTCCGHPRPDEPTEAAAARRLREEMGLGAVLTHAGSFLYRAEVEHGLTEHELDHVFVGRTDGDPQPDPAEVAGWRWLRPEELRGEIARDPARFTVWFERALAVAIGHQLARSPDQGFGARGAAS